MTESELIQRALGGDASAWEPLVRAHQQAVFRLAFLLLRDADEAEDVAQETFIRAFRHLRRFDPALPLRPWLLRIAANVTRNRQRSIRRYVAALQRWLSLQPAADQTAAAPRAVPELHVAIAQLRRIDQEVLYLRYFLELSEGEMAAALNIAPGTVKSRLHRAGRRLRELLERDFQQIDQNRYE